MESSGNADVESVRTQNSMDPTKYPITPGITSVKVLRCSRCVLSVEVISRNGCVFADEVGMVNFGHNLYYCNRCSKIVGYK